MGASGDAAEQLRDVPNERSAVERVKRTIMSSLSCSRDRHSAALAESELGFRYEDNLITCGHHAEGAAAQQKWVGTLPGQRAADAGPLRSATDAYRVYELLRDPGFVVLVMATDKTSFAGAKDWAAALAPLATLWFVSTAGWEPHPGEPWLIDEEGLAHARFGVVDPTVFVVRPDNRVGFRCEPPELSEVIEYLRGAMPTGSRSTGRDAAAKPS